jgi:hypothetical protein
MNLLDKLKINHRPRSGALDLLKYIGPGLLVTVGFIDPGNWATNLAAGSEFGYALLVRHADHYPAQRGPPRYRDRPLPLGGDQQIHAARAKPPDPRIGHARQRIHLPRRDTRWSHRPPDAVRYADQGGSGDRHHRMPRHAIQ